MDADAATKDNNHPGSATQVSPEAKTIPGSPPGDLAAAQDQQRPSTQDTAQADTDAQAHTHIDYVQESVEHGLPETTHSPLRPDETQQGSVTQTSTSAPVDTVDELDTTENPFHTAHFADEQALEVDEFESDSAIGSDTQSTTTSLSSSIYHYRSEHGRTYHAYKDGKYIFPNDEREADRLDLQHHVLCLTYNNQLHFAPVENPRHVLDVGTGTGIWAIDYADQHPDCQVIGIDLSPGQPTLVPPNLKFIVDDAEDVWLYQDKFDLIHARLMAGCFADWPNFFRQSYDNLEPGGWLELQDYGLPVKSQDGTHVGTNIHKWGELLCEAGRKMGRRLGSDVCDLYVEQMQQAGFVDVQQRMFMWPSNGWPKDPFMKELGRWNQINCLDGLEGFCLALLTRGLGWKKEEVDVLVALTTKDFMDRKIHAYFPMPVVYGRKPFDHEKVFQ